LKIAARGRALRRLLRGVMSQVSYIEMPPQLWYLFFCLLAKSASGPTKTKSGKN
jgi:hypothetical protein